MPKDKDALIERCNKLRNELKAWEKQFALANGGKRANRDDIKADQLTASRYKAYNKLREALAAGAAVATPPTSTGKRKLEDDLVQTPSKKRSSLSFTPRKAGTTSNQESQQANPSPQQSTPTTKPNVVGPTPQKDGRPLGIFDILHSQTPSKGSRTVLADIQLNVVETPSRTPKHGMEESENVRHCRSPQSSAKRLMLDMFMTPQRPKDVAHGTPSPSMKAFATPAFLRRHTLPLQTVREEDQSLEQPKTWRRKSFGRSLSSTIADMRRQEEHEHDEELRILHEMESGEAAETTKSIPPTTIVKDGQFNVVLDVDGFVPSDFEEEFEPTPKADLNAPPKPAWRKKGLKRQTKRVNMRPVQRVAIAQTTTQELSNDDSGDDESRMEATDGAARNCNKAAPNYAGASQPERVQTSKHQRKKLDSTGAAGAQKLKRKKKGNALAHTNFVRLKIRNKNSRSNGRGPFGRKR